MRSSSYLGRIVTMLVLATWFSSAEKLHAEERTLTDVFNDKDNQLFSMLPYDRSYGEMPTDVLMRVLERNELDTNSISTFSINCANKFELTGERIQFFEWKGLTFLIDDSSGRSFFCLNTSE